MFLAGAEGEAQRETSMVDDRVDLSALGMPRGLLGKIGFMALNSASERAWRMVEALYPA